MSKLILILTVLVSRKSEFLPRNNNFSPDKLFALYSQASLIPTKFYNFWFVKFSVFFSLKSIESRTLYNINLNFVRQLSDITKIFQKSS